MEQNGKQMKFTGKKDWLIVTGILILAAGIAAGYYFYGKDKKPEAVIYDGSEPVMTILLETGEEKRFTVPGKESVVFHLFEDGTIGFEQSDCPDQVCIKAGRLGHVGQSAACLPNELILKIIPAEEPDQDDLDIIG